MQSRSLSSLEAAAITLAPSARATSMTASPTPPAAPSTTTHSSGCTTVRRVRQNQAVA